MGAVIPMTRIPYPLGYEIAEKDDGLHATLTFRKPLGYMLDAVAILRDMLKHSSPDLDWMRVGITERPVETRHAYTLHVPFVSGAPRAGVPALSLVPSSRAGALSLPSTAPGQEVAQ